MTTADTREPESTEPQDPAEREALSLPPVPEGFVITPCDDVGPDPDLPDAMPPDAELIATLEWSWSPASSLILSAYLSLDRTGQRWVLWHRVFDDEQWTWDPAEPRATAPCCGLKPHAAALLLMAHGWKHPDIRPTSGCFHMVSDPGLLDEDELELIENAVWPEDRAARDE